MRSFVSSLVIYFCFCQRRNRWKGQSSLSFIYQDFYLKVVCNFTSIFKTRLIMISVSFRWEGPALNILTNIHWGIQCRFSLLICFNKSHKYFSISFQNFNYKFLFNWNFWNDRLLLIWHSHMRDHIPLVVNNFYWFIIIILVSWLSKAVFIWY